MFVPLFVFLALVPIPSLSVDPIFNDDVLGLVVLKAGIQDPDNRLASWNEDDDSPCNWDGIKCDPKLTNRVTEVVLDGFSLSGRIGRGLLRLQFLRVLSLSRNNFSGTINPNLTNIRSLEVIDLTENNLTGRIPYELFGQCGSLRVVSLAKNNLTGRIPGSISYCSSLVAVNFSSNMLSGQIPVGMWFLRGLQSIDLSDNMFEGEIKEGLGNLYDVRVVNLRKNMFTGHIPEHIGSCLLLKVLDLGQNSFIGNLPETMRNLQSCAFLSVRGNSLAGNVPDWIGELRSLKSLDLSANWFSGEIPESIGRIQLLKHLNLSMNNISGNLPESMANCSNLLDLDVSQNSITGDFPYWVLGRNSTGHEPVDGIECTQALAATTCHGNMAVLDVSSNSFSGMIPGDIGALISLEYLDMSRNSFSGSIPSSLGNLSNIKHVDMSNNHLEGSIPPEIGLAGSLKVLRLERNSLGGIIPTQIGKCFDLQILILSHNNLMGPVPPEIGNLSNLQIVDLSSNDLTESLPKELTNLSSLISFNVSHNHLEGELPVGGFFDTIAESSVSGNPKLCGSVVKRSCPAVHPKPIVLNPNSSTSAGTSSSLNHGHKRVILSISTLTAIAAAAFITIGVITVTVLNIRVRSSMERSAAAAHVLSGGDDFSRSPTANPNHGKLFMFTGDASFAAGTQGLLSKDSELGRGGFGVVYRTVLGDGRSVAIKKLTISGLIKSQEEFESEMRVLGKIRHPNLVTLEGYYCTSTLQLLIYEFVPGGSLHKHLHDRIMGNSNCLTWQQRFEIIIGMAKGLSYLHQMGIIHYNLKSTNVLLDTTGFPKIGDFGLARLLPELDRCILSSKIQSALGYMAPEFACRTVRITEKCDIYGFGILVLEIVTGRRPVEYMEDDVVVLCEMVRGALEDGKVEKCVDEKLQGIFPAEEAIPVIKLGLICASQVPSNRPDMSEVVNILELIQCSSDCPEDMD